MEKWEKILSSKDEKDLTKDDLMMSIQLLDEQILRQCKETMKYKKIVEDLVKFVNKDTGIKLKINYK
tara:strand:- start:297 stop:497 length:201 start_codon:yes stop_codon:yes gene_type:complete